MSIPEPTHCRSRGRVVPGFAQQVDGSQEAITKFIFFLDNIICPEPFVWDSTSKNKK